MAKNLLSWLKSQTLDKTDLDEKLVAGAKRVGNKLLTDPLSFSPLSMREQAVPMAKTALSPFVGKQTAEDVGYGLRGSLSLTPFQRPGGNLNVYKPTTDRQRMASDIGQSITGTAMTAPLGGSNPIFNIAKRVPAAATLGAGIATAGAVLGEKRLPTAEDLKQGAFTGTKNQWQLAITNPLVDKALGFLAPQLTEKGLGQALQNKQFQVYLKNMFNRAMAESIPENTMWVAMNKLNETEQDNLMKAWMRELPGTILGNVAYAGIRAGGNFTVNRDMQKEAGKAFMRAFDKTLGKKVMVGVNYDPGSDTYRQLKSVPLWKAPFVSSSPGRIKLDAEIGGKQKGVGELGDIINNLSQPPKGVGEVDPFKNPVEKPQMDAFKQEFNSLNKVIESTYGKLPDNKMQDIRNLIRDGATDADIKDYLKKPEGSLDRFTYKQLGMDKIMGPITQEPPRIKIAKEPPLPTEPMELRPKTEPKYDVMARIKNEQELTGPARPLESKVVKIAGTEKPGSFTDRVMRAKTKPEIESVITEGSKKLDVITKDFENRGIEFTKVVDDLEAGRTTRETKALKQWFDLFATKADQTMPFKKRLENYFHRTGEVKLNKILEEGVKPDTFGSTLLTPSFYNKRTGSLTEYVKDPRVLKAYMIESLRNAALTPAQKQDIKLAQEIVEGYTKDKSAIRTTKDILRGSPFIRPQDVVEKMQKNAKNTIPEDKVIYDGKSKAPIVEGASETFKSPIDESMSAGTKFYDAFARPFREAQLRTQELIKKLSVKDMTAEEYNREVGRIYREQMSGAAFIFKNNVENAEFKQEWMKNLANRLFDEYIGDGIRKASLVEQGLAQIRVFAGRGALGLNVSSAINNILEIKRVWSSVSTKSFVEGTIRALKGEDLVGQYGINSKTSTALERNSFRGKLEKVDRGLFYLFDKSETLKDNILLGSLEAQAKAKGMSGKELTDFVIQKFDKLAIKYGTGQDIGLYRSPLMKTIFQFGQYPIKDAVLFGDKLVSGIRGDKGDAKYVAKYAIASVVQMAIMKAVIGKIGFGDQTNTPIDLANNLKEGEIPTTPLVQALVLQLQDFMDGIRGIELSDYDQEQRNKQKNRSIITGTIPASNQLWFKTGQTIKNQQKGYQETFSGNVANPVSSDPLNVGRSLLLGPSYDKYRQEYGERRKKLTDEKQSTGLDAGNSYIFKQLSDRDQQRAFYDTQIAESAKDQELSNIKIKMQKGEEPTDKFAISDKTPRDKKRSMGYINKKIEEGFELTPEEAEFKYLDKYNSMPTKTKYESMKKDEEGYKVAREIYKYENMTQDEKVGLYKKLQTSDEEIEYFEVASDNDTLQRLFVEEQMSAMTPEDRDEFLLRSRTSVNGKMMLTDTIINKMKDDGILSAAEAKALKRISFVKDNSYKGDDAIRMGDNTYKPVKKDLKGSGKGFGTDSMVKMKMPSMPRQTASGGSFKITIPQSKAKSMRIKAPVLQKRKNWRNIKLLKS